MATTSKKSSSKKTKTTRKVSTAPIKKTTAKKVSPKKSTTQGTTSKAAATKTTEVSAKVQKPVLNKAVSVSTPLQKLRSLNFFVAFASVLQAGLILFLSKAFGGIHSVFASFPTNDSLATASSGQAQIVTGAHRLFDVHLSWLIAAFLIVTAVMHLALATILRKRYEREVAVRVNRVRWATYAISGSLLLVTIALAAGVSDLVTLLAIVGFNVIAALVALSREHYTQNGERTRLVYGIGAIAAGAPFVIFLLNILGTHQYGEGGTPKYVYWLYFTGFVIVSALARNLIQQTRVRGRWIDYIYAERVYIWLSLIGSSAVAWEIYSAVLKK